MATFVTGGNGFIGAAVVKSLVGRGEGVRALVRRNSNLANLAGLPVELVYGDIRDVSTFKPALAGARTVIHLAADYRLWTRDPEIMRATNVDGTRNVLAAAADAGVERIVHVSTVATIGQNSDGAPADETALVDPPDLVGEYKRTKFAAEEIAMELARRGAPIVVVNPSTPVGPGDLRPTPTGRMIRDAAFGRIPAFVDTGLNIVDVRDVARGVLLAAELGRAGQRYVLGGVNLSLKAILTAIAQLAQRRPPRIALPRKALYPAAFMMEAVARLAGHDEPLLTVEKLRMSKRRMFYTSQKARTELNYEWGDVTEALRDAVAYFLGGVRPTPFAPAAVVGRA